MSINTAFFDVFNMAADRHLGVFKFEISTAGPFLRANMRHHAKRCAGRSNRCRDMAIFGYFRMAAGAIMIFF